MIAKIALFTVFLVEANCFYLNEEFNRPTALEDLEDLYLKKPFECIQPVYERERRQLHGVVNKNPDGTTNILAKLPLVGNDKNVLSAIAALDSIKPNRDFGARTAGLALDNVNGLAFTLTDKEIPNFGDQITAAAKVKLVNTEQHDLSANAFASRSLPNPPALPTLPKIPNFNTYGGGVDYMFDKTIGASLGVAHTPKFQKTDYSALGKFKLFRDRSSSFDFNAGASKSVSPFIPSSSWQPTIGFSLSKYF